MKSVCLTVLSLLASGVAAMDAQAETWPARPLRVIVPFGAGSTTDIVPRVVFEQLSSQLGQSIIVENRAGAGGTIGSNAVAKAEPDGYTLLVNSSAYTISPSFYPNLPYDPVRDLVAVVPLGISPHIMVVSPARGFRTVGDFVAAANATPGGMNFSSVGGGTATHISAERFMLSAKIQAVHVPFKSGGEAMTEVLAGRIDFFFGPVGLVVEQVKSGSLSALVANGARRSAALPDLPTTSEAGFVDAEYPIWFGIFMPAKTPGEIIDKLHRETMKALQTPALRDKLAALGVDPMVMTPAEFHAHIEKEITMNSAVVKAAGIKAN